MKSLSLFFLFVASVTASAQIGGEVKDQPQLTGIWKNYQLGHEITLILNADGSGDFQEESMHYTAKDGKLVMTMRAQSMITYTYALSAATLIITGGDLGSPLIFKRSSTTGGLEAAEWVDKKLLGKWKGDGETFEFLANGKCYINEAPVDYKITKGNIVISTQQSTMLIPYAVSGDRLDLAINGAQFTYSKITADASTEPAVASAPAAAAMPALPQGQAASIDPDLLGAWYGNNESMEFRDDGMCVYNGEQMEYKAANGHIFLTTSQGKAMIIYSIVANKLKLTINGERSTYARGPASGRP